mgnify:CR=1 FL=1
MYVVATVRGIEAGYRLGLRGQNAGSTEPCAAAGISDPHSVGSMHQVDKKGNLDSGIGRMMASGKATLIPPTLDITYTGQNVTIDGVEMVFHLTPGTEAPVDMHIWFPHAKALSMAENSVGTLHNLLTIRGAQVRAPLSCSRYLHQSLQLY